MPESRQILPPEGHATAVPLRLRHAGDGAGLQPDQRAPPQTGLQQSELARAAGHSASFLSLSEHSLRRVISQSRYAQPQPGDTSI